MSTEPTPGSASQGVPAVPAPKKTAKKKRLDGTAVASKETESTVDMSRVPVREGGTLLSSLEVLFRIGATTYVFDSLRLATIVGELEKEDNPLAALLLNNAKWGARDVVYVPAQKALLRQRPLTVVATSTVVTETNWPYPNHIAGVHAVVGGTGAGKSKFLQEKLRPDLTLRWGEPTEPVDAEPSSVQVTDMCEALSFALILASAGASVSIDSLRPMMFSIEGAAGPGGVSVGVYSALTDLNNICSMAGVTIAVNVNPMVDGAKEALVYNNIAASVAGMTTVVDGAVTATTVRSTKGRTFTGGTTATPVNTPTVREWDPNKKTRVQDETHISHAPKLDQFFEHPDDEDDLPEFPRTGVRFQI